MLTDNRAKTIVVQSHTIPLPADWIGQCLQSVELWAEQNNFDYQFIGDEIFSPVDEAILQKTRQQKVIATDLARLIALRSYLQQSYQTVVWCDADFLIFDADNFTLPETDFALGRETWVQSDNYGKLKVYNKVHNAFLMFRQNNSFLDFYIDTATRLLTLNSGSMPPQFIGPKLLTALHNIIQCPVLESAGMFSPLVMQDIENGYGLSLEKFKQHSSSQVCAANLCSSLIAEEKIDMPGLIQKLLKSGKQLLAS